MRCRFSQLVASLCLLAVWIATPLLSVAHIALEEHSYCAEHERLEEQGHADSPEQHEAPQSAGYHLAPDLPGQSEGNHEECAFGDDFTRECLSALPSDCALAAPASEAMLPAQAASQVLALSNLLLLAPKTSPPLAS